MERLRNAWNSGIERIQEMLGGLKPRDRLLLLGLMSFALFALVVGSAVAMNRAITSQRNLLEDRQKALSDVTAMAAAHAGRASDLSDIEGQIKEHGSTDLQSFLAQAANSVGISDRLDSVRPKSTTPDQDLEDDLYSVALSNLTLEEYANFLYEIESAGYPLKIRTTKVRVRSHGTDPKTLMVDMDISAFRLVDAAKGDG